MSLNVTLLGRIVWLLPWCPLTSCFDEREIRIYVLLTWSSSFWLQWMNCLYLQVIIERPQAIWTLQTFLKFGKLSREEYERESHSFIRMLNEIIAVKVNSGLIKKYQCSVYDGNGMSWFPEVVMLIKRNCCQVVWPVRKASVLLRTAACWYS